MARRMAIAAAVVVWGWAMGTGTATAAGAGCASASADPGATTLGPAASAIVCLVNGERRQRGLPRVRASRQLGRAAVAHSRDMVARRFFGHVSPEGETVRQRVVRTGYLRRGRGEIEETLGWGGTGFASPRQLVEVLMRSALHRQILLERRFRDIGVGLVLGAPVSPMPGSATLTLNLGRRR